MHVHGILIADREVDIVMPLCSVVNSSPFSAEHKNLPVLSLGHLRIYRIRKETNCKNVASGCLICFLLIGLLPEILAGGMEELNLEGSIETEDKKITKETQEMFPWRNFFCQGNFLGRVYFRREKISLEEEYKKILKKNIRIRIWQRRN